MRQKKTKSVSSSPKKKSAIPLAARQPVEVVDGILVKGHDAALLILDSTGTEMKTEPGETTGFRPVYVDTSVSAAKEIPGFQPPPPSSILWLAIMPEKATAVTINPIGLFRNAARWGRPAVLLSVSPDDKSGWRMMDKPTEIGVPAKGVVRIVAIGHGFAINPASIFSTLVDAMGSRKNSAAAGGKRNAK